MERNATLGTARKASLGTEPQATLGTEPQATLGTEPQATLGTEPQATLDTEPQATLDTAPVHYAVVDVETSGLRAERHRVLQVGVVVVDADGTVLARWSSLVRPRRRWWYRVGPVHVHGIHRRDVRGAPPPGEVLRRLAELLDGTRVVAHNAGFDVAFLRRAAAREGIVLPLDDTLCTLRLSRQLDPQRQLSHRLGDVAARYGIPLVHPHDALADAEATAAILPHLLRAGAAAATTADSRVA